MQVEYDSVVIGARSIIALISNLGYNASLPDKDCFTSSNGNQEKEKAFWKRKVSFHIHLFFWYREVSAFMLF